MVGCSKLKCRRAGGGGEWDSPETGRTNTQKAMSPHPSDLGPLQERR